MIRSHDHKAQPSEIRSSQKIIQGLQEMETARRPFGKPPMLIFNICCLFFRVIARLSATAKKGAFRGAFFSICHFAGVGHLAPAATVSSGDFLPKSTHTHTDVRHPRLLHQLLIVGALFSNCASLQISLLRAVAECTRVFCKLILLAPGSIFTSGVSEAPASKLALSAFQAIVGTSQALV